MPRRKRVKKPKSYSPPFARSRTLVQDSLRGTDGASIHEKAGDLSPADPHHKPVRGREEDGTYRADDPSTPTLNEAFEPPVVIEPEPEPTLEPEPLLVPEPAHVPEHEPPPEPIPGLEPTLSEPEAIPEPEPEPEPEWNPDMTKDELLTFVPEDSPITRKNKKAEIIAELEKL